MATNRETWGKVSAKPTDEGLISFSSAHTNNACRSIMGKLFLQGFLVGLAVAIVLMIVFVACVSRMFFII